MWWFFQTMHKSSRREGDARTPDKAGRCADAHAAFIQSLILLFVILGFAIVSRLVFGPDSRLPLHLLHDLNAAFFGAQSALCVYRVVVLREQCT